MKSVVFLNDEHKNYLKEKLQFYQIENYQLEHINFVIGNSHLIIKTNFNLDKCLLEGELPLSEEIIKVLQEKGGIKIVFFNETEPDNYDVIKLLRPILLRKNIDESRIVVISNNEELVKYATNSQIKIYVNHPHIYASAKEMIKIDYEINYNKKYLFQSYNRNLKAHRFFFLCLLKKYNILSQIDWSWLRGDEMNKFDKIPDWFYDKIMTKNEFLGLNTEVEYIKTLGRKISEYEYELIKNLKTDEFDYPNHYQLNTYNNSYIHIVNESYYEDKSVILLSEKSIIPLYFSQIPIYLSSQNHLKYLRQKYCFDLFDDFINHDYDNEYNNYKRMNMIADEIVRINKNRNDTVKFYKSCKKRFDKNKILINDIVNNFEDSQFLKDLIINE